MSASRRIGLIGCVKTKRNVAAPARDLYTSALFRGRRAFVDRTCERWFILSAEHGLVAPNQVLAPYERALKSATVAERRAWSDRVLRQIDAEVGAVAGCVVEIHAGAEYREFGLDGGLRARGATIELPTQGLAFGAQLAFYKRSRLRAERRTVPSLSQRTAPPPRVRPLVPSPRLASALLTCCRGAAPVAAAVAPVAGTADRHVDPVARAATEPVGVVDRCNQLPRAGPGHDDGNSFSDVARGSNRRRDENGGS